MIMMIDFYDAACLNLPDNKQLKMRG